MSPLPDAQVPAIHHRRIGDVLVTSVSDGFLDGSMAVIQNIDPEDAAAMLRAAFRPVPRRTALNCFLIRAKGRTALIDTGAGTHMQASAGRLMANLAAAGVAPGEIDMVVLTHMHPDHSNGLADADGAAFFPNAELAMHQAEHAYWMQENPPVSAQGVPYFAMAHIQASPYADRLKLFNGGEVFPGVTAMHLPGHTPGHCGFRLTSGNESLLIWGDIVHVPEIQVPRPEVTMTFDVDPAAAAATRAQVFDMVAADGLLIAGMHLHFPGVANLAREAGGYRLYPEAWRQTL
jgi:glyoxylase-like metal-dependent hydrolase (beta-lactamase superfamily II)